MLKEQKTGLLIIAFLIVSVFPLYSQSDLQVIQANSKLVSIKDGDKLKKDIWTITPSLKPDIYETTNKNVTFYTDSDSISINLSTNNSFEFLILLNSTDTAYTLVKYKASKKPDFSVENVTVVCKGLSQEYSDRFTKKLDVFISAMNELKVNPSIAPIKLIVTYKDGQGLIWANIVFDNNIILNDYKYKGHNNQWRSMGEGISVLLQDQILTALGAYKKSVAIEGLRYNDELLKIESAVRLNKNNGDWIDLYAYNYLSDRGQYPHVIYKTIRLSISGKSYETETANLKALNSYSFFFIGEKTGLDGKKSGAYYLIDFFDN
jgi:hypothetical protein